MRTRQEQGLRAFTLIELLIVIAIILILIAIALPNFLEAQIRARVTKAQGEMKSLVTATVSYRLDWREIDPLAQSPWNQAPDGANSEVGYSWWGFASYALTSPNQYIGSMPVDPFFDTQFSPNAQAFPIVPQDPPYAYIRDTAVTSTWDPDSGFFPQLEKIFHFHVCHNGSIYYSSGPDLRDNIVNGTGTSYAPTNGTASFGDLYQFGLGDPYEDIDDTSYAQWGRTRSEIFDMVAQACGR